MTRACFDKIESDGGIVRNVREDYLEYLKGIVDDGNGTGRSGQHDILFRELYGTQFEWKLSLDEDRALDGIAIRDDYIYDNCIDEANCDFAEPCSVLEMLIALAQRIADDVFDNLDYVDKTPELFWEMLANIDLVRFTDDTYEGHETLCDISERLSIWMNREFDYDGTGSIFPLEHPESDQRNNLIWYQKEAYLAENYPV